MPNNKAPGPDGLPAELYKHFWMSISPLSIRMIADLTFTSTIPPTMNTEMITPLLKPDKGHPANHHPLSLVNTDMNIEIKALESRIKTINPFLIHPDQTGFIKGTQSSHQKSNTLILSLDAERAFDRVNRKFLFVTLQKCGFRQSFMNWIRALYTSPIDTITKVRMYTPSSPLYYIH